MRLFFKKGKQRKLLEEYKKSIKVETWVEVAKHLKVNPDALKEWLYESVSLPSNIYFILDKNHIFQKYIVSKRSDSWGQSLGGINSSGSPQSTPRSIKLPLHSPELAECFGIILGDGCVYISKKYLVYQVRVASHPIDEEEYSHFVSALFERLFGVKTYIVRSGRARYVTVSSKKFALYLKKYLPGLKTKFVFPSWMFKDPECLRGFIRGLVDTDGSVYRLSNKNPNIVRIGFKNADESLIAAYRTALLKLDFHPSKLTHRNVFLTSKSDTERYIKEIGFHNSKHRKRLIKIAPSYSGQIFL
ncbi:LAGLIDADG-like domain protein [uncultured archaeon]|nr:LAGLIDADG-like domain protein [uncultured archaeon]